MNAAGQVNFPLDLLGILGAGERIERLATAGTSSLIFRKIVSHFLSGKVLATFSAIALGARLLTPFASRLVAGLVLIRRVGVIIKSRSRIVWVGFGALLGFSAEDLPLQPSYSRQGFLELTSQRRDLGLLTANDLFEPLSLALECRFSFGSPGMLCPPVVGLLAEFNL
jgi:hypothetical protein